jgi:hypothetical protein
MDHTTHFEEMNQAAAATRRRLRQGGIQHERRGKGCEVLSLL